MTMNDEGKKDVLLALLQERYTASHNMRDRSMQFAFWVLGLGTGLAWLLITETSLSFYQKIMLSVILVLFWLLSFLVEWAIDRGFDTNRRVTITIEDALHLFDAGAYVADRSILPTSYRNTKKTWSSHFLWIHVLIGAMFVVLAVLVWSNPRQKTSDKQGSSQQSVKSEGGK